MSTGQPLVGKIGTPSHTVSVVSCPYWLSGVTEKVKYINNDNLSTTVAYIHRVIQSLALHFLKVRLQNYPTALLRTHVAQFYLLVFIHLL